MSDQDKTKRTAISAFLLLHEALKLKNKDPAKAWERVEEAFRILEKVR